MAYDVDVIDRRGPSNEMRCQLQPKKTKGNAVLSIYIAKVSPPFITNKTECFSFKSGCVI